MGKPPYRDLVDHLLPSTNQNFLVEYRLTEHDEFLKVHVIASVNTVNISARIATSVISFGFNFNLAVMTFSLASVNFWLHWIF